MLRKRFFKYVLITSVLMGFCVTTNADVLPEEPEEEKVVVDKTVHDFGTIKTDTDSVSAVFTITNTTKAPVMLSDVKASCGCTTPDWTKEPIEPEKTGKITATYRPKGNIGPFEKSVTIYVSVNERIQIITVKIKGTVAADNLSEL